MGLVRVLIVDDDRSLRDALRRALTLGGYDVRCADGGQRGLELMGETAPDAVVLDLGMPDVDGLEVCRRLRRAGDRVPILMLTARDAVADRIEGLDAGADDCLVKPFDVGELKARLRALLRRNGAEPQADGLVFAELRLDAARHGVAVGEQFVELTRTELALLELMMLNPRRVLSHSLRVGEGAWPRCRQGEGRAREAAAWTRWARRPASRGSRCLRGRAGEGAGSQGRGSPVGAGQAVSRARTVGPPVGPGGLGGRGPGGPPPGGPGGRGSGGPPSGGPAFGGPPPGGPLPGGPPPGTRERGPGRGPSPAALAEALGIKTTDLQAALDKLRAAKRDEFAAALAKRLDLPVERVKAALSTGP